MAGSKYTAQLRMMGFKERPEFKFAIFGNAERNAAEGAELFKAQLASLESRLGGRLAWGHIDGNTVITDETGQNWQHPGELNLSMFPWLVHLSEIDTPTAKRKMN